jgi:hypothetical protein
MPSCIRPHRQPNGLVIGPLTGQMSPDDETWVGGGGALVGALAGTESARAAAAARIRAAIDALAA